MEYTPDCWVVLKFVHDGSTIYKVFAGWYGGFANGDSWKLNSGITKVEVDGDFYLFHGSSGSVYRCHKKTYRCSGYMNQVYDSFEYQVAQTDNVTMEKLPMETNWLEVDYGN